MTELRIQAIGQWQLLKAVARVWTCAVALRCDGEEAIGEVQPATPRISAPNCSRFRVLARNSIASLHMGSLCMAWRACVSGRGASNLVPTSYLALSPFWYCPVQSYVKLPVFLAPCSPESWFRLLANPRPLLRTLASRKLSLNWTVCDRRGGQLPP